MLSDLQLVYMRPRNSTKLLKINTTKFQVEREPVYISPIQLSEVGSVKELCKMRDGLLFSDLSKRDIQILIDLICIS